MFCNSCGTPLPDGSVFCSKCGCRLGGQPARSSGMVIKGSLVRGNQPEPVQADTQPYIPPETIPAYNPQANIPAYSAPEIIPAYGEPAPRTTTYYPVKEKKKLTWLWVLLGIAALAAAVVGILFLTGVLGSPRYPFIESISYYSSNNEYNYTIEVELNDDGYPETMTRRYHNEKYYTITDFEYDSKNNMIRAEVTFVFSDGEEMLSEVYEYNDHGDLTKEVSYSYDGTSTTTTYDYSYDNDGNITETTTTEDGKETSRYEYEYDKNGNNLETIYYSNGEKSTRNVYEYDKYDNLISRSYTDYADTEYSAEYTYENEYDGKLLVKQVCYRDGEKYYTSTYEYDKKGNETEHKTKYTDGHIFLYEYEYNDDGNLIENTSYTDGEESTRYKMEYDDDGNMTEQIYYYNGEQRSRYEYTYFDKAMKLSDAQIAVFNNWRWELIHADEED